MDSASAVIESKGEAVLNTRLLEAQQEERYKHSSVAWRRQ